MADLFANRPLPNRRPGMSGFNAYAAGNKYYGGGRNAPNVGAVNSMQGYNERDTKAKARKNAILKRMKSQGMGNPMNINVMRSDFGGVV